MEIDRICFSTDDATVVYANSLMKLFKSMLILDIDLKNMCNSSFESKWRLENCNKIVYPYPKMINKLRFKKTLVFRSSLENY